MPESKHRRGGKNRPREHQTHAPVKNPPPSPTWVPATGVGLLIAGLLVVLIGYLEPVANAIGSSNVSLIAGFVLMAIGFGFLARWR
jgi:hypothetical protein